MPSSLEQILGFWTSRVRAFTAYSGPFAGFEEPVEDVAAAVSAGSFGAGRHGKVDFTAGVVQFFGDLPTRARP